MSSSKKHHKKKLKLASSRDPTVLERNTMTQLIDATIIEAICKILGRTDWWPGEANDIMSRGKWQPYDTGEEVWLFDGEERFLVGPWRFSIPHDNWGRDLTWLFDRHAVKHHTLEDEAG